MNKPKFVYYRKLNWDKSRKRLMEFFDTFPYDDYNAKMLAAGKPEEQLRYRVANVLAFTEWVFHLVLRDHPKKIPPSMPIRFPWHTVRTSLAKKRKRTTKTVDRYLKTMRHMGIVEEKRSTGRGLELVLAAHLFVFDGAEVTQPAQPAPAAVVAPVASHDAPAVVQDPVIDGMVIRAARHEKIGARIAEKFGVSGPQAPT